MRSTFATFCLVLAFHGLALVSFRMGTAVTSSPMQVASFALVADSYVAPQKVPAPEPPTFSNPPQEPIPLRELSKPEIRTALPESTPPLLAPILSKKASTKFQPVSKLGVLSKAAPAAVSGKPPIARSKTTASKGSAVTVRPRYRNAASPVYPAESRRLRQEGQVLLLVKVSARGRVENVVLRQSSGFPLLDLSAMTTVRRWTFEPAMVDGVVVASEIEVPIRFRELR